MTRGDEVVVVDYKFGMLRKESHREQVEAYAKLLKKMGYSSVRGYLWYITLGDVEQVV
jgi:CRISPR/Cas system-associated exonuclease Cas4 (RecB family)